MFYTWQSTSVQHSGSTHSFVFMSQVEQSMAVQSLFSLQPSCLLWYNEYWSHRKKLVAKELLSMVKCIHIYKIIESKFLTHLLGIAEFISSTMFITTAFRIMTNKIVTGRTFLTITVLIFTALWIFTSVGVHITARTVSGSTVTVFITTFLIMILIL